VRVLAFTVRGPSCVCVSCDAHRTAEMPRASQSEVKANQRGTLKESLSFSSVEVGFPLGGAQSILRIWLPGPVLLALAWLWGAWCTAGSSVRVRLTCRCPPESSGLHHRSDRHLHKPDEEPPATVMTRALLLETIQRADPGILGRRSDLLARVPGALVAQTSGRLRGEVVLEITYSRSLGAISPHDLSPHQRLRHSG